MDRARDREPRVTYWRLARYIVRDAVQIELYSHRKKLCFTYASKRYVVLCTVIHAVILNNLVVQYCIAYLVSFRRKMHLSARLCLRCKL